MHPKLAEIIRIADELGYVDILMNSNGPLLSKHWLKIKDFPLTVIVSLGSTNRDKYASIHAVDLTEFDELHKSLRFMHDNPGEARVKLNCHYSIDSTLDFEWIKKTYPDFKIVKRYLMPREGKDLSIKREKKRKPLCPHLLRRLTVHANGEIFPCCMSYNAPADIRLSKGSFAEALLNRDKMIIAYKNGVFPETCKNCPSADVYTWKN